MFSVLAKGSGRYRLEDGAGADVGWIRGKAIGVRGLRNDAELIAAASAGWRALQTFLHRDSPAWLPQEVDWERLRFVYDGAHEWISDGRVPLARACRSRRGGACSRAADVAGPDAARRLSLEFVVPSWLDEERVIPLARTLWHALSPLVGETSRATRTSHRASQQEWRPSTHAVSRAPDALSVG